MSEEIQIASETLFNQGVNYILLNAEVGTILINPRESKRLGDVTVFGDYLLDSGFIYDPRTIEDLCKIELSDEGTVSDIVNQNGNINVITENKLMATRAFEFENSAPSEAVEVLKYSYSCTSEESTTLDSTTKINPDGSTESQVEVAAQTFTVFAYPEKPSELFLDERRIVDASVLAYDFHFSDDGNTVLYTSYESTAADAAPKSLTALDVVSGQALWTLQVSGNPYIVSDKVFIEVLGSEIDDSSPQEQTSQQIQVVDIKSGQLLETIEFSGQLAHIG